MPDIHFLFSISRCQIFIYVVALFSVMNARCTLLCLSCSILIASNKSWVFNLCQCSRHQMYIYVFNMFVVLDTTHLIVFSMFSDSQLKTDCKYKNEISNIVEVKTNLLSNSQTLRQCYFHLLRKRCQVAWEFDNKFLNDGHPYNS
jgi:hypothetical protein